MRSRLAALFVIALLGAGCAMPLDTCGEFPADGGPAILRTREQEMCEVGRIRMRRYLETHAPLEDVDADELYSAAVGWQGARSTSEVIAEARELAGNAFADGLARAIEQVRAKSARPHSAGCDDPDLCLAQAAGHGARLALEHRHLYVAERTYHLGEDIERLND